MAVAGAISSFIAYQKKKLCFRENGKALTAASFPWGLAALKSVLSFIKLFSVHIFVNFPRFLLLLISNSVVVGECALCGFSPFKYNTISNSFSHHRARIYLFYIEAYIQI